MKRAGLAGSVRARLRRLAPPYASHYGVVPLPPPEGSIRLGDALASLQASQRSIAEAEVIVRELRDPFLVSRVLVRKEAVSSSAIEGTHSTLTELLSAEESNPEQVSSATRQVESY